MGKSEYSVFAVTTDAKAKLLAYPGVLILLIQTFVDVRRAAAARAEGAAQTLFQKFDKLL